jgi:hypothetical protein
MSDGNERKKRFDRLLDAGVVIVALLIGFFLGRTTLGSPPPPGTATTSNETRLSVTEPIGKRLALPGIDWEKNQRTLVLALQTGCHFCSESSPFYQRIVKQRARFGSTQIVAVLPQTVDESREFLKKLGVTFDEIKQGSFGDIGVRGTPTLLLVNSAGIVTEAWRGKLPTEAENAVLARLQIR